MVTTDELRAIPLFSTLADKELARSGSVKRVAAGVGEGSMAIAFVHHYLQVAGLPGARAHPEGVGAATKS